MEEKNNLPRPGEFYRYWEGGLFQIVTVAIGTETGEPVVVFQALQDGFEVYAQPLAQFSEAERIEAFDGGCFESGEKQEMLPAEEKDAPDPLFFQFLDTDDREERMELLQRMKGRVGQRELDSLCLVLDAKASGGSVEEQLDDLISYLKMQLKYDAPRLRRG